MSFTAWLYYIYTYVDSCWHGVRFGARMSDLHNMCSPWKCLHVYCLLWTEFCSVGLKWTVGTNDMVGLTHAHPGHDDHQRWSLVYWHDDMNVRRWYIPVETHSACNVLILVDPYKLYKLHLIQGLGAGKLPPVSEGDCSDQSLYLCWSTESVQVWCREWCPANCPGKEGDCCSVLFLSLQYMYDLKCVVFKTCMYQVAAFVITDGITLSYVVFCPHDISITSFTWSLLCSCMQ